MIRSGKAASHRAKAKNSTKQPEDKMLLPIEGKRGAEKKAAKPVRTTGRKKAGQPVPNGSSEFLVLRNHALTGSRARLLELTLPFPLKGELWRLAKRSKIGAKSNRSEKFVSNIKSVP